MNEHMKWIDSVRGTDSIREVARRIQVTHSTLARQINGGSLTFESVRDIARSYRRPVIAELIATGHLTAEDAGAEGMERMLQAATDEHLTIEVGRRLGVSVGVSYWDAPLTGAVQAAGQAQHDASVHDINELRNAGRDQLEDGLAAALERGEDEGYDDYDA